MQEIEAGATSPGFRKYPGYHMEITPSPDLHQIIFNEAVIAASDSALIVREQNLRPAIYIPINDIDMAMLSPSEHNSHCPFKGDACYWTVSANGETSDNAAWSYLSPYLEVSQLNDHIAFYLDKMTCYWRGGKEQPLIGPGNCETFGCDELQAA